MTTLADALPAWLVDELAQVRDTAHFLGTDELAAASRMLAADHPDRLEIREIGRSGHGEPLLCLTVDAGAAARDEAVVVGVPHPNEPVGGLTALHLARRLATDTTLRNRLGLTWHIVPNIDPDGLRLNEGWLRGPFTRRHYTRNFYRQASAEQIDWNFPLDADAGPGMSLPRGTTPPETEALMRLIDRSRPALLAPLHNAEVGGVFYYVGQAGPALFPVLQRLPPLAGMSLHQGIREAPWVRSLADGIHQAMDMREAVEYRRAHGGPPAQSTDRNCSAAYAGRFGALALVTEVPYWRNPRSSDATLTPVPLAGALIEGGRRMSQLGDDLAAALSAVDPDPAPGRPLLRASRHFARSAATAAGEMFRPDPVEHERRATVAELASVTDTVDMFRLRDGGMLLRALDGELAADPGRTTVHTARDWLRARYDQWAVEADRNATAAGIRRNPIRALVAVQYGSLLAAADHLAQHS